MKHKGLTKQTPAIAKLMEDTLLQPIKKHTDNCQCNGCLVAVRKRELRAKAILNKEAS